MQFTCDGTPLSAVVLLLLTLSVLTPFTPANCLSSAMTLLVSFSRKGTNEFFSQFSSPWWIFVILGLLERSGPSESHPGSSPLNMHRGATSMSSWNYFTMPRKGHSNSTSHSFSISSSSSADFHDSNCAAKLRSTCFRWCPLRMRCANREIPWHATKKLREQNAQCREFRVHTVAAPSIFHLSRRTLYC